MKATNGNRIKSVTKLPRPSLRGTLEREKYAAERDETRLIFGHCIESVIRQFAKLIIFITESIICEKHFQHARLEV